MRPLTFLRRINVAALRDWLNVLAVLTAGGWAIVTLHDKNVREDQEYRGKALAVAASCAMDIVGETDTTYLVRVQLKVASASRVLVGIFDSPYQILGTTIRVVPSARSLKDFFETANRKFGESKPFSEMGRVVSATGIPLEVGRLWKSTAQLEPNERFDYSLITPVGKKTLQTFDALTFVSKLLLARSTAYLGDKVTVTDGGDLKLDLMVYSTPKKDHAAISEDRPVTVTIPEEDLSKPEHARILKGIDPAVTETTCTMVSPFRSTRSGSRPGS